MIRFPRSVRPATWVALTLAFGLGAVPATAQDSTELLVGAGVFDVAAATDEGDFDAIEAGLQIRWPTDWAWGIGPMAGVSANDDGAWWTYLGARRPFALGNSCWNAGLTFAVTYYEQGDSKDLGNELEFRSGLEFFCRRAGGGSTGFEFYHLSNASISDVNPGENSLWIYYSVPLGR